MKYVLYAFLRLGSVGAWIGSGVAIANSMPVATVALLSLGLWLGVMAAVEGAEQTERLNDIDHDKP